MTVTSQGSMGAIEEDRAQGGTYIVQRGDTLAGVALRLGVKQSELKRANRMYGSKTLMAGQLKLVSGNTDMHVTVLGTHIRTAHFSPMSLRDLPVEEVFSVGMELLKVGVPAAPISANMGGMGVTAAPSVSPEVKADKLSPPLAAAASTVTTSRPENVASSSTDTEAVAQSAAAEGSGEQSIVGQPLEVGGGCVWTGGGTVEGKDVSGGGGAEEVEVADLLYENPSWAPGDGRAGLENIVTSRSRQASDASCSAPNGVSLKNVIRYMFSPSATAASSTKGAGGGFSEHSCSAANADSAQCTPSQDRNAASPEPWAGGRGSHACSNVSPAALPPRTSREASNASGTVSTAQTLLSMVTPKYWSGSKSDLDGGDGSDRDAGTQASMGDSLSRTPSRVVEGSAADACGQADSADAAGGDSACAATSASLKLPGLVAEGSTIVTHVTLARMEAALSKHYRGYNWYLLFSTYRDGASYTTLYNRIKAEEPTYVVVESMNGEVFGGFATSAWCSGCQYYGTGECFLFSLDGERTEADDAKGNDTEGEDGEGNKGLLDGTIKIHEWTGMNTYLQYSDCAGLGMGGGGKEGSFGLFIGDDFLSGSTGTCDTFDNPPLCSQKQFQISQVEVWGFTTADTEMGARLERLRKTLRGKTTRPL